MKSLRRILSGILGMSLIVGTVFCTACVQEEEKPVRRTQAETEGEAEVMGVLDNVGGEQITFYRLEDGEKVSLLYNGATCFYSAAHTAIADFQLSAGAIIEIAYIASTSMVNTCRVTDAKEIWHNTKVTNFSLDETRQAMTVGSSLYAYSADTKVYSNGEQIGILELNRSTDQLEIWGTETKILSIIVTKGHGYLSLSGDDLFTGGLITIGTILVRNIEEGMLLAVTEGTYTVRFEHGVYDETREVTIVRGEQARIDLSDVPAIFDATGNVFFNLKPDTATLTIDGTEYDADEILTLTVGTHTVVVAATGYESETHTFDVVSGYQEFEVDITGEEETGSEEEATDEEETDSSSSGTVVSTTNTVTVSLPEGASIYFDGTYKGTAPVTFAMVTGNHVITVLEGTSVRSYSVNLAEGGDDVVYDFSED